MPFYSGFPRTPATEMESNGKNVNAEGMTMDVQTSPVVWGETGTNGQHAFFQMLHQGTDVVPLEFIVVERPDHDLPRHHSELNANALAQSQALMNGRFHHDPHKRFQGNRPSSTLVLANLTPATLRAVLAMYEHRIFVSGSIWGINSFDQWGVERGKILATDLGLRFATGDTAGLDSSTAGLLHKLRTAA